MSRASGRTTRLVVAAREAARKGQYVLVVAANAAQAEHIARMVAVGQDARLVGGNKVYVGEGSVSVVMPAGFDFQRGWSNGMHPSVQVMADHLAIEEWAGWALREWLRWSES